MLLWDKEGKFSESMSTDLIKDHLRKKKGFSTKIEKVAKHKVKYILGAVLLLLVVYFLRYYIAYLLVLLALGVFSL